MRTVIIIFCFSLLLFPLFSLMNSPADASQVQRVDTPTPFPPTFTPTGLPSTPTPAPSSTPTPTPTPTCNHSGDAVDDDLITAGDAQLAFEITLGLYSPSYVEFCEADCNADGDVTAGDAQIIFETVLGQNSCVDPV